MKTTAEICSGSYKEPTLMVEQPARYRDNWGFMCGPTGTGVCVQCRREVGLTTKGVVARHNTPEQEV